MEQLASESAKNLTTVEGGALIDAALARAHYEGREIKLYGHSSGARFDGTTTNKQDYRPYEIEPRSARPTQQLSPGAYTPRPPMQHTCV